MRYCIGVLLSIGVLVVFSCYIFIITEMAKMGVEMVMLVVEAQDEAVVVSVQVKEVDEWVVNETLTDTLDQTKLESKLPIREMALEHTIGESQLMTSRLLRKKNWSMANNRTWKLLLKLPMAKLIKERKRPELMRKSPRTMSLN